MTKALPFAGLERWVLRAAELVFLLIIAILAARVFWLVLTPSGAVSALTQPPVMNTVQVSSGQAAHVDLSVLTRSNAFAISPDDLVAPETDAPETSLNLVLRGLRAVTGDGAPAAMIVTPDNRLSVYAPGDELLDGVVLSRILSDRVILDKSGTFESLFLEGRTGELNVIGGQEPRQSVEGQVVVAPSVHRVGSFQSLMRTVSLSSSQDPAGWRVNLATDESDERDFGVSDGDIIVSVDGRDASALALQDLAELMSGQNRTNLVVKRNTQTLRLSLVFEEPN